MSKNLVFICLLVSVWGLCPSLSWAAPSLVGKVSFTKGSSAAQQPGAAPRILGQDSEIFQGDNIQTSERSFVVITFKDGAKVTVRPNSNFSVDNNRGQHPQLALHEGEVRASGGDAVQGVDITTPVATVKGQAAEYSVRVCQKDCGQNGKPTVAQPEKPAVARVVDIKGVVTAQNSKEPKAQPRQLSLGNALYSADTLRSQDNSYALMVFLDGEKITLQPNSEMVIADYSFQNQDSPDRALFRLTIGGMRALTGSIGKTNKSSYAIDTPVGTIGIRGTGFDLYCLDSCRHPGKPTIKDLLTGHEPGFYAQVWQGQIFLKNDGGEYLLTMPESGYIANANSGWQPLPELPPGVSYLWVPRPDSDHTSPAKLLHYIKAHLPTKMLVTVHQGQVHLHRDSGNQPPVTLGKGQTGHLDQDQHLTLENNPSPEKDGPDFNNSAENQNFNDDSDTSHSNDATPNSDNCP